MTAIESLTLDLLDDTALTFCRSIKLTLSDSLRELLVVVNRRNSDSVLDFRICNYDRTKDDIFTSKPIQQVLRSDLPTPGSRFSQYSTPEVGQGWKRLNGAFKSLPRWHGNIQPDYWLVMMR